MGVIDVFPANASATVPLANADVGVHLLLDLFGVPEERLKDTELLARALTDAARAAHLTALAEPTLYRFPNGGLTGFLPLAESHIAFHTYPERGFLAADLFTCGSEEAAQQAATVFCQALSPARIVFRTHHRGQASEQ